MLSPRGRNFVLGLDKLSSSSGIWPRHVLRLCNLASSMCVFHDKAQANDLHSTIRPMPSQYKFTIYRHLLTYFDLPGWLLAECLRRWLDYNFLVNWYVAYMRVMIVSCSYLLYEYLLKLKKIVLGLVVLSSSSGFCPRPRPHPQEFGLDQHHWF